MTIYKTKHNLPNKITDMNYTNPTAKNLKIETNKGWSSFTFNIKGLKYKFDYPERDATPYQIKIRAEILAQHIEIAVEKGIARPFNDNIIN